MDHSELRKIVIAGGSGFLGRALADHFAAAFQVVILSRKSSRPRGTVRTVTWNGCDPGDWIKELDGTYALINLTGKNVNCRYDPPNKKEILESRLLSTAVLGYAISQVADPPKIWIQMSSATIYRHSNDKPMDETYGEIGDDFSMNVCKDWERAFNELKLDGIRRIIMRTSIVLGRNGGALTPLRNLVRIGLGGRQGGGDQMVSWIHERDLIGVVEWMLDGTASGLYNVTAPQPIKNDLFMKHLRSAYRGWLALPTPQWLLTLGAKLIGTETELVLKSRWVIPKKLLQEGYRFRFPSVESALKNISGNTT